MFAENKLTFDEQVHQWIQLFSDRSRIIQYSSKNDRENFQLFPTGALTFCTGAPLK